MKNIAQLKAITGNSGTVLYAYNSQAQTVAYVNATHIHWRLIYPNCELLTSACQISNNR